jgi:glycosyltransferase involved in cell wall biosynthesis
MKVSIITVTRNSEKFLGECINSIENQRYKNIEYIVVDGKSTDGTLDIIKKHEDTITKWISESDKGMYDALNKGMKMATGDIIGILHSDDVFDNDWVLEDIVNTFKTHETDAVFGDLQYVDRDNLSIVRRTWRGKSYKRERFLYGWMPAHPTFYIKRSAVEAHGGYESHYYTAADYEFMARYLYKHKISAVYMPDLVVKMRMGGASNINLKQRIRANRRDYLAMKTNNIPFALVVSILKPLLKLHQFKNKWPNLKSKSLKKDIATAPKFRVPTILSS